MKMKRWVALILALSAALLMAGCNGEKLSGPEITAAPASSPAVSPTPETVSAPTPTPEASPEYTPEPAVGFAERISGMYSYCAEGAEDEVYAVEFYSVDGKLLAEVSVRTEAGGNYSEWAAEFEPMDAEAFNGGDSLSCAFMSREYSGFSMAGEYWDEPAGCDLAIVEEGLLYTAADGTGSLLAKDDTQAPVHDTDRIKDAFEQIYEAPAAGGDFGSWRAKLREDGRDKELYIELGADGLLWFMKKAENEPLELFRGAYAIEGELLRFVAERAGYAALPHLGEWRVVFDEILNTLCIYETDESGMLLCCGEHMYVEFSPAEG